MAQPSKRMQTIRVKVMSANAYPIKEAIQLLKFCSDGIKFKESMDVSINLGVDPRKSDQAVRSSTVLPHGTGKTPRVAVFAQGEMARLAHESGADLVGFDDLSASIKAGQINFDVLIATPDSMRIVGQLGQILGPKGLMPNPKVGTVTPDVVTAIKNAKGGQVRYRADKGGIIHCALGKIDFDAQQLLENLRALLSDLKKVKPASAKGIYIRKVTLSSTMGPGLLIDQSSIWDLESS